MLVEVVLAAESPPQQKCIRDVLRALGAIVDTARHTEQFWERISRKSCDLIVVSQSLIPLPAAETIRAFAEAPGSPGIVVLSEREDSEERAELLAAGCEAVLHKKLSPAALEDVLEAILEKRRALIADRVSMAQIPAEPRLSDFASRSPAMQSFMAIVRRVVGSDTPLLFLGETGVGKERLARAIHAEGPRASGPFIAVNCGALPDALLESELFGHEEGAFTGANRDRRGWFELAHRGTILLDEIADLPHHLQVKLLRVLQDREVQRVGSEKSIRVDVRVMAATNRELEQEVEEKRFRRDLYYRLSVVTLNVPPLRERIEDIPPLAESYVKYFGSELTSDVTGITPEAMAALTRYEWPGNVRELMNIIERAMLLCDDDEIDVDHLPAAISGRPAAVQAPLWLPTNPEGEPFVPGEWAQMSLAEARKIVVDRFERMYLAAVLKETKGRVGEAAKRAGIQPRHLFDKMKAYGLHKEDFKPKK